MLGKEKKKNKKKTNYCRFIILLGYKFHNAGPKKKLLAS